MSRLTPKELKDLMLSEDVEGVCVDGDPDATPFTEIQEKIRSGEIKVEMGPTLHIDDLGEEVDKLFDLMGIESAFCTDMSMVRDYSLDVIEMKELRSKLDVEINESDYIYQVAQRMRDVLN